MSRFNQKTVNPTLTTNFAGGQAYQESPELELVSILLTSFVNDTFYRSANDTVTRVKDIIDKVDPKFAAQAAIYARTKFGMRSISHVVASELAKRINGQPWAKSFYNAVIYRADDMLEIASYHKANNGKMPNAMKKGFAQAFSKFDAYQIAKYRGDGKGVKLIDLVNMVHPVPIEKNGDAIKQLVAGTLKNTETWEAKLSATGGDAEAKDQAWATLLAEGKLGYMALLKNLRNIIEQSPESIDKAIELLTNEKAIKKSLVLPFRFVTAFDELAKMGNNENTRKVANGINDALDISLANVPVFDGSTLVVLDVSGSMTMATGKDRVVPAKIGALFAAVIAKANNCDMMVFQERAGYLDYNSRDSITTIAQRIPFTSGGTNFHAIFNVANKKYDRVIILSDMQGWMGGYCPKDAFNAYKRKYNADPFVYSFDLAGLGTLQFPENKVFAIAGFSDKVFDLMATLEQDKNAMVNAIKSVTF